jgi:hypothetical protein
VVLRDVGTIQLRLVDEPGAATDSAPTMTFAAAVTANTAGNGMNRLRVSEVVVSTGAVVSVHLGFHKSASQYPRQSSGN